LSGFKSIYSKYPCIVTPIPQWLDVLTIYDSMFGSR
jgi:hypothetical protein